MGYVYIHQKEWTEVKEGQDEDKEGWAEEPEEGGGKGGRTYEKRIRITMRLTPPVLVVARRVFYA